MCSGFHPAADASLLTLTSSETSWNCLSMFGWFCFICLVYNIQAVIKRIGTLMALHRHSKQNISIESKWPEPFELLLPLMSHKKGRWNKLNLRKKKTISQICPNDLDCGSPAKQQRLRSIESNKKIYYCCPRCPVGIRGEPGGRLA